MKPGKVLLPVIALALFVAVLTAPSYGLWVALPALAARLGVAIYAIVRRRRADASQVP